ncbi:MAG TPA: hypothetical protein VGZ47_13975, partial [Gemmataceae bacterium]|nr:hypothetical protein [Gemmataceae bacterium]
MSSKSRSMVQLNLPSILRTWAELGAQLAEQRVAAPVDWASLHRIIAVARLKLAGDAERLRHVLDESRKMLHPLEEPFDVDLGLHRWLDSEREEAYSDWLEWVIFQAKNPKQVFALFHLQPPASVLECEFQIQRECCIPYGHTDHEGRLDLVIRFAGTAI